MSLFILVILALVIAVPVLANSKDPVGERVVILFRDGETSVLEGPFHVFHGVGLPPSGSTAFGKFKFVLEIDGVEQKGHLETFWAGDILVHAWLFNYPEGLPSGEYEFTGKWYGACWVTGGPCEQQNASFVDIETITVIVP